MLNDAEVWLDLYKLVYQSNCNKLSYFGMAGEADHLFKEFYKRFPSKVLIKDTPGSPANQNVTWANVNSQTPFARY